MVFEFKLPDIGEGVVEGEIVRWLVKVGDRVKEDQLLVEVMTDKATVEIPSPVAGTIQECVGSEGDIVDVGATLIVIETDEEEVPAAATPAPPKKAAKKPPVATSSQQTAAKKTAVLATPAIRKVAREMEIDLAEVSGSGPQGRITAEDVQRHAEDLSSSQPAAPPSGETGTIPYRGLRRKIGIHLSNSKRTAAHYTYVEEVDMTELVQLRKKLLDLESGENRPTYLPFIMKAVVAGLRKFPLLNAELDEEKQEIRLKKEYHIGLAIATQEGLVVPVVKDVDKKNLRELTREISRFGEFARAGKLKLDDLQGGTFTITSLGALGGLMATPIINYPEVAILGVHKVTKRPVVQDDKVVVRDMMNLSISLDHRVVDGAVAAGFMQYVISFLQAPGLLLLEGD
jgi:pyruvate dehydrogenase E2 component (dihydrolipoamide acetyltransferase)